MILVLALLVSSAMLVMLSELSRRQQSAFMQRLLNENERLSCLNDELSRKLSSLPSPETTRVSPPSILTQTTPEPLEPEDPEDVLDLNDEWVRYDLPNPNSFIGD